MLNTFERSLNPGQAYPCTLDDLRERLSKLPSTDISGLWSVGLVSSTRHDRWANARYVADPRPEIHIYSYPADFTYRLPAGTRIGDVLGGFKIEREFGMTIEAVGTRWVCRWQAPDLRRFILDHVLLHEVGHHVFHMRREAEGLAWIPRTPESERFAEMYARMSYLRSSA